MQVVVKGRELKRSSMGVRGDGDNKWKATRVEWQNEARWDKRPK